MTLNSLLNQGTFIGKNNHRMFFQNFDAVQIVGLTPDSIEGSKWHMKQFYGSWITGATAGGCINHINTFPNNPQFLIKLKGSKAEYTCVIGLIQKSAKQAGSGKIGSLQIGNISKGSFYSESAIRFSNLQNKIFQKTILDLKFKIPAHNSIMLWAGI